MTELMRDTRTRSAPISEAPPVSLMRASGVMRDPRTSVLVAGIGNIFLSDDGFGVEVVRHLGNAGLPAWVRVADFGISGLHLAYELACYRRTILVDSVSRGGEPGTVYVIEATAAGESAGSLDAHGMQPEAVLCLARQLGPGFDPAGRVLVVGCEPACLDQGIGLSPVVAAAVPGAAELVTGLVRTAEGPAGRLPPEPTAKGRP